jgi:NosR/NirI family nitrous oxide reductase transcriptional regulator
VKSSFPLIVGILLIAPSMLFAVERFPPPEFESGHQLPEMTQPPGRAGWLAALDLAALVVALSLASYLLLKRRSRRAMFVLAAASLAYFGFYRQGCICPIGAIQNVSLALANVGYVLPLTVLAFFILPLVFALLFGRVFCGGVCPLGAIQDVVLLRPVKVPNWINHALRPLPFVYLGLAVFLAATDSMFVICAYDPFVSFFRLSGPAAMLIAGGAVLILAMFVARPYCRFLCPYGVLLGLISRFSWKGVRITPDQCVVCRLCEDACPFGAINGPENGV